MFVIVNPNNFTVNILKDVLIIIVIIVRSISDLNTNTSVLLQSQKA